MEYSEIVISAFAAFTKTIDLMKATGLSRPTINKYKKDSHLMELAAERRSQVVKEAVYKMQTELTKCIDTLAQIRDDKTNNPQIRAYACNCIMNHCKGWTVTLDITERVEALEKEVSIDDEYREYPEAQ